MASRSRPPAPPPSVGTVHVSVATPTGTSAATGGIAPAGPSDQFTNALGAPTVSAVTPSAGGAAGGTSVTITGSNFVAGSTTVSFGGAAATGVSVANAGTLTATSPARIGGIVDVTVTNADGTSATGSADKYAYLPQVAGVSPAEGAVVGGNQVTITGTGFTGATAVDFGTTVLGPSQFTVSSDTQITATAPAGSDATGAVNVQVVAPGGTSPVNNSTDVYIYGPTITGISPPSGTVAGGTTVT